jgi:hypothetical protein
MKPSVSTRDWQSAAPEDIKAGIASTRSHMDALLSDLGRKLRPKAALKRARIPLAAASAGLAAFAVYKAIRAVRASRKPAYLKSPVLRRFRVKSLGILEYAQALRLLASVVRKGKPAVFIVEPR